MNIPERPRRKVSRGPATLMAVLYTLLFLLVLAACGSSSTIDDAVAGAPAQDDVIETSSNQQVATDVSSRTEIVFEEADQRGEDAFAPEAEITECRPEELIAYLDANPGIAAAWADAADIDQANVAERIRSLQPTILTVDTRVTNHAYKGGTARGFQATLEAGTAVLVDDAGVPRVRCACGNPLAEPRTVADPQPVPEEIAEQVPDVPVTAPPTTTLPPVLAGPVDFCTTWAALEPTMTAGPAGSGSESMQAYFDMLVDGFDQLVAAGEATSGFPTDALVDMQDYRDAIAATTPADPGPGPDDVMLGLRVEDFLTTYCDGEPEEVPPPTHLGDDGEDDDTISLDGTTGTCGSLQFALLLSAAEGLGLDHAEISQPFIDAMNAVVSGADPGPGFDVGDLSMMLANEHIGCLGAQAMQQLFDDAGLGDLLDGTPLGA